jgi:hypothetical protein
MQRSTRTQLFFHLYLEPKHCSLLLSLVSADLLLEFSNTDSQYFHDSLPRSFRQPTSIFSDSRDSGSVSEYFRVRLFAFLTLQVLRPSFAATKHVDGTVILQFLIARIIREQEHISAPCSLTLMISLAKFDPFFVPTDCEVVCDVGAGTGILSFFAAQVRSQRAHGCSLSTGGSKEGLCHRSEWDG